MLLNFWINLQFIVVCFVSKSYHIAAIVPSNSNFYFRQQGGAWTFELHYYYAYWSPQVPLLSEKQCIEAKKFYSNQMINIARS